MCLGTASPNIDSYPSHHGPPAVEARLRRHWAVEAAGEDERAFGGDEFYSSDNEMWPREKLLWAYPIFLLICAYIFGMSVYFFWGH